MKKLLFLWVLVLTTFSLKAQSKVLIGDLYYNLYSDNTAEVTDLTSGEYGNLNNLIIPASVEHKGVSYSVTSIGNSAFRDCRSLTSITIPESVTSIEYGAFNGCTSLTSITIPNSVTSIGDDAFSDCDALTSIIIPESVTSIGWGTFSFCNALTSISIPESVTSIGDNAFSSCTSLTSVTIPNSVTSIGEWAFDGCEALTSVTIEANTPPTIGTNLFTSNPVCTIPCGTLTAYQASDWAQYVSEFVEEDSTGKKITYTSTDGEIVTPYNTDDFGANIVSNTYENGVGTITFDDPVTSIGNDAFRNCSGLTSITIPKSVTSIGYSAFNNCSSLTSIIIPKSVTSIGDDAFSDCDALISIIIPKSVTSIGDRTFYDCDALTSIIIPNSVTSIGNSAFSDCTSLTSITIPESVTSIEYRAFSDCTSLTSITIPESVTSIGEWVFSGCKALTSITIPESVTSIGNSAFSNCNALNSIVVAEGNPNYDSRGNCNAIIETTTNTLISGCKSTIIPESVTSIGDYAFEECSLLTSITIHNSVTCIGNYAFRGCRSLTSVTIPNSVTSIGNWAFSSCSSLTSVTIPNSVTSIRDYAFYNCNALTSITIPESVTSIGEQAFRACSSLTSITIPNSVTSIGQSAFRYCSSLTSVTIEANTPPTIGTDLFSSNPVCTIPCGTLTAYEASDWAQYVSEFVEEGCEEPIDPTWQILYTSTDGNIVTPNATDVFGANIVNNTYENGVGTITFDGPVTSIGDNAFFNCQNLSYIELPNNVTSIGMSAFANCTSLSSITIPNSVTSIGESAFARCTSLTSIAMPNSVTSIGVGAFCYCPSITTMVVEGRNSTYDSRENCNAIIETATNTLIAGCQNTIVPNTVTSIGMSAFSDCTSLTSITIPESVTSIGEKAFKQCSSLTSITIPESVTSIGKQAFYNCSQFSSVTIGSGVTSIGVEAFELCSQLISVTIGSGVTNIGNWAFSNCSSLTSITCEATVPPTLGMYVFQFNLKTAYIPCGTKEAYEASDWAQYVSEFIEEECEELIDPTWQIFYTSTDGEIVTPGSGTNVFGANIVSNTYENGQGVITFDGPVTSIGNQAFWIESALTSITIPNSVTSIGNDAFCACENLISITIPNSVTSIGARVFSGCYALTSVTIPNSVKSIGDDAFRLCSSLTSITIPESVTSIGKSVFNQCSSLTSITIPNTVKSIGDSMFSYCSSLTSITIPNSVTSIGNYAFNSCSSLTSITIPECVTSIGIQAFMNCKGLTTITIPNSVTSIGQSVFRYCSSLTSVTIEANTPPTIGTDLFSSNPICTIPCGTLTAYQASDWAQYVSEFVEEGCVEPIDPTWQITYTSTDAEIVAPCNTDDFGANIVNNTYENGVGTITFDGPVTSIGHNAFFHCQNLSYIELPNSVTSIGISAFADCTRLSSITIPNSVTSIGESAFARCTSLTSIAMPNSVTSIGVGAFCYCPSITTMVVEGRNSTYDSRENCNAIIETATNTLIAGCQKTVIPNTVTSIGMSAFSDCTSLTSITIPESVTSIGKQAFYNCSQFSSVTIGSGVTSIGVEAFELCSQLTSVTIGSGVTNIGKWAFYSCSSLTSITCEATVPPTLGMYVFPSNLETVYIPCGTKEAYEASDWKQYVAEFIEECEAEQYTRDVTPNRYGTICLPFGSTDFSGATFYEIAYKAPFMIYFDEVTKLEAGKPYVFYAHSNKLIVTSDGSRVNNPLFDNGLYGTFDEIIAAVTNILTNNYIVNNNSLCMCGEYCSLPANRAYVKLDEVSSTARALAPGRKRVSLSVQGENTSTALDNISEDTGNIPTKKGVYDILGRKMFEPTGIGFYIIDGQKVIIAQ